MMGARRTLLVQTLAPAPPPFEGGVSVSSIRANVFSPPRLRTERLARTVQVGTVPQAGQASLPQAT